MKIKSLPKNLLHHGRLAAYAAFSVLIWNQAGFAQELTPVRQLGQGGTAANPYDIASDGLVKRQQREISPNALASAQGHSSDNVDAWWAGMDDLAVSTMTESNWHFRFGLTAAYEYDTNFAMRAVDEAETQIISVSPYGVLSYGEQGSGIDFQLRYAPEFRWFSNEAIEELVNHTLSTSLGINGARSRISVYANYNHNEGGNIEVGNLVTSDIFTIGSLASYDVSDKTTVGGTLKYSLSEYDAFNSFSVFNTTLFADYAITPKTRLGLSVGYEHVEQDLNLSADAFNASIRASWAATDRIRVDATVGVENREFDGGESFTTPAGDVGIGYNISDKANVRLSAYRRATPSIGAANTMFYSTGVALSGTVQATDKVGLRLVTGFENAQYESTSGVGGVGSDREDDYFFIRPSISYTISSHWSLNLFYQYSDNDSSIAGSIFERSQVGLSITLAY
jgi:hypothetical protein